MSRTGFRGAWRELQGSLMAGWSSLVKDEMGRMEADVQRISGILEGSYGLEPEDARPYAEACVWDAVQATWSKQLGRDWEEGKRRVAERWEKIAPDQLAKIEGQAPKLLAAIEAAYGTEDWQAASEMLSFFRDWREKSA